MEHPEERNMEGLNNSGELGFRQEVIYDVSEESAQTGGHHQVLHFKSSEISNPGRNIVGKQEIAESEVENSQGYDAVKTVKQHISDLLVSKYVNQNKDLSKSDADHTVEVDSDPVVSVKKQISNLLQEKYSDMQKSREKDFVPLESDRSEKSKQVSEIHLDSMETHAMKKKTDENHLNYTTEEGFDSGIENVIEGYSIAPEEFGENNEDTHISKSNHNILPKTERISAISGENIKLSFNECENDEASVNETISSIETSDINVEKSSVLPPELLGENVTFQEVDRFAFENCSVTAENTSEEEVVPEHDIKHELKEAENKLLKTVPGTATKVTLDLTTISKLTNIWDRSYKNERKQKKTIQPAYNRQSSVRTCNTKTDNDFIDSVDAVQSVSGTSDEAYVNKKEENINKKADIQNLQISEALKMKLMNWKLTRPPNSKLPQTKRRVGRPPKLHKTKNQPFTKINNTGFPSSSSLMTKVKEQTVITEGNLTDQVSQKRKAGRPRKLEVKNVPSALSEEFSVNNQIKEKTCTVDANYQTVQAVMPKRTVGRPKKNIVPVNLPVYKPVPANSCIVNCQLEKETCLTPVDNQNYQVSQGSLVGSHPAQKRKVGRPKKLKVINSPTVNKTNITTVKLKKLNISPCFKSFASKCQTLPKKSAADSQKIEFQEIATTNNQKRKVGRPKSVKHLTKHKGDKAVEAERTKINTFNLKSCFVRIINVDCNTKSLQENDLKIDFTLPRIMPNENVKLKPGLSPTCTAMSTGKAKPGRPKKIAFESEFKKTSFVKIAPLNEKLGGFVEGSLPSKMNKANEKRKPGRPRKVIKEKLKPKIDGKIRRNKTNPSIRENMMSEMKSYNSPQLSKSGVEQSQENEFIEVASQDISQHSESGIEQSQEKGVVDIDSQDSSQNSEGCIEQFQERGAADMWEDDWLSESAGDSSDDYLPSEEEYIPNKNEVLKNVFCMKRQKKDPITASSSENKNNKKHNTIEKNDCPINKHLKTERKVEKRKYNRFKHTGHRIGRPPVVGEYKCKHCSFSTYEKNLVQKHHNEVHRRELKKCQYCDFVSRSENVMLEHEGRKHTDSKPFKCDFEGCDYATNVYTDCVRHTAQRHAIEKSYKCPKCDFRTKWKRNVRHHDQTVHNDVRAYVCNICNFAFKRSHDLKGHMDRHTDDKPLQCDECGFRCKTNWEIRSHKLTHSNVRPYPCTHPGCKQACKTKSDLSKHMVVHTTSRTYKCSMCPRMYKNYTQMKKHERGPLHKTSRDFKCEVCSKAFKTKQCLEKHQNLHKGIRPFKCNVCDKDHSTKHNLKAHMETHKLDERPFHCPVCPFGTKLPGALLAHIGAMHGKSYAYYCELCKKPFKRYSQLQMHYRRCHTKKDQQKLGNAFEVDYALMKMEMELDLEENFGSLGTSKKKTVKPRQNKFKIKDEPLDEGYDVIEQNIDDSELPPDLRNIGKVVEGPEISNVNTKVPRKRGRPKKNKIPVNTKLSEVVNTSEKNISNDCHNSVNNISKNQSSELERSATNSTAKHTKENLSSQSLTNWKVASEPHLDKNEGNGSNIRDIANGSNIRDTDNKNEKDVDKNASESALDDSELKSYTQRVDSYVEVHINSIKDQQDSDISNNDTQDNNHPSNQSVERNTLTVADKPECVRSDRTSLTESKDKGNSATVVDVRNSETNEKLSDNVLTNESGLSNNHMNSESGLSDNHMNSESGVSNNHHSESVLSDNHTSEQESENNKPKSVFVGKIEENGSATLAIYDGFRLPLATKGFHFNYEKRGKKTKSWFMDPSYMDPDARKKQMQYLKRIGMTAKLSEKKRVFKGKRKQKHSVPKNLAEFVKDRKRKMNYYMKKRKLAEGGKLTSEELKELQNTLVFERQKRKTSFKGNYAKFETLEGEELSVNDLQECSPLVLEDDEGNVPKKRRKMLSTSKTRKNMKKKQSKNSVKKKQFVTKNKDVLLYSERKATTKDLSVRKPAFIDKSRGKVMDDFESNKHVVKRDKKKSADVSAPLLKRKRGRKPKEAQEKKRKINTKPKYEPVKPKLKYVKRSQQKKNDLEKSDLQEDIEPALHGLHEFNLEGPSKKTNKESENNIVKTRVRPYVPGEAKKAMKNRKKIQNMMKVKISKAPQQTRVDPNNSLSFSSAGMLHEAVTNSQIVRVHLPQNVHKTGDEQISFPDSFCQQTNPGHIDIRHVVEGGKSLMYCDDVAVMRDLNSSQEILGLSVDQIKSETFIEPVEPFSVNPVFKTGQVVNPVHPILLTQSSFGNRLVSTTVGMDISEAPMGQSNLNSERSPSPSQFQGLNSNSDTTVVRGGSANVNGLELDANGRNREQNNHVDTEITKSLIVSGTDRNVNGEHIGRLSVQESDTDKEVMQLDYSIVKNEPEDE